MENSTNNSNSDHHSNRTRDLENCGFVPETLAEKALDRFKSFAETGEVPTLEQNPSARGSGDTV